MGSLGFGGEIIVHFCLGLKIKKNLENYSFPYSLLKLYFINQSFHVEVKVNWDLVKKFMSSVIARASL